MKTEKEKLFDQYIDKWVDKTYLSIWKMKIHYLSDKAYRKETGIKSNTSIACCYPRWGYLIATILVNRKVLNSVPKKDIEYYVLHELMHIFLDEMSVSPKNEMHEERVATLLAHSFLLAAKHD